MTSRSLHHLALAAAALAAGAAQAAPAPRESWGKPGVSYEAYRADALECGKQGYLLDISHTDDAQAFVRASRQLDDATQSTTSGGPGAAPGAAASDPIDQAVRIAKEQDQIQASVQPERRMARIKTLMQATVDKCLAAKGYVRFALKPEERRELEHLKPGSDARRTYLYKLASAVR